MLKPRRSILFLLFYFCATGEIFSQHIFVSNLYNNYVFTNPSLAGINDFSLLQLNYRNQWPVDGIYNTYGAAYFHSLEDYNSNIGATLNHDRQYHGFLTNTSIGLNYTYKLRLSRRNYLYFGLNGNYSFQQLNYNALTFENPAINIPENRSNFYPTVNSGLTLSLLETHYLGISAVNLIPIYEHPLAQRMYCVSYMAHIEAKSYNSLPSYIEPVAAVYLSEGFVEYKLGFNLGFYNIMGGLLVSNTGININSLNLLLGTSFDNYEFIYAYDLNLSGVVTINPKIAAHEVTFLVKFKYKRRRTKKRAIKCPDI
jgi:type IX secretion system PorP/SprF family membrane protein